MWQKHNITAVPLGRYDAELEASEPRAAVRAGLHGVADRANIVLYERFWEVVSDTSSQTWSELVRRIRQGQPRQVEDYGLHRSAAILEQASRF